MPDKAAYVGEYGKAGIARTFGGGREKIRRASVSGAVTVDLADGNVHVLTLTGAASLTFLGATPDVACSLTLHVRQDATGGRALTYTSTVRWPGGAAPTLTSTAGALDLLVFETLDGGQTWIGSSAGVDYR